jgi:hypothetical protein
LRAWRRLWHKRLDNWANSEFDLPKGQMRPLGYTLQQHGIWLRRPIEANNRWFNRIPGVYHQSVLGEDNTDIRPANDPDCLAIVKHYRSLVSLAQEARKPIFELTPADGAIGNHAVAAKEARDDFHRLAEEILLRIGNNQLLSAAHIERQTETAV